MLQLHALMILTALLAVSLPASALAADQCRVPVIIELQNGTMTFRCATGTITWADDHLSQYNGAYRTLEVLDRGHELLEALHLCKEGETDWCPKIPTASTKLESAIEAEARSSGKIKEAR